MMSEALFPSGRGGKVEGRDGIPPVPQPGAAGCVVIGLGNPILGDDGVGWRVAESVAEALVVRGAQPPPVEVICLGLGGLGLMEQLVGYRRAILVDALAETGAPAGLVRCFTPEDLPAAGGYTRSVHDATLQQALEMGRALGAELPKRIEIVAIAIQPSYEFGEMLSPAVEAAVPAAVRCVLDLIDG